MTLDGVMQSPGGSEEDISESNFAGSYELVENKTSPGGVIISNYSSPGEVKTGSFSNLPL
jgi:hypothetical protein